MGWSFGFHTGTKQQFIEEMVEEYQGEEYAFKPNPYCKGILYILTKNRLGQNYIAVLWLDQEDNGFWGYKGESEMVGPCVYDCPKRLLDKSEVPDVYGWRKKCHEYRRKAA